MSTESSRWNNDALGDDALENIYGTAASRAAASLATNPRLAHLLYAMPPEELAERTSRPLEEQYLEAAAVMEAQCLTADQQAIARLVVGSVVVFGPKFTALSITQTFNARPESVYTAISALAAKRDRYAPPTIRYQYRLPLLAEIRGADDELYLGSSKALDWLVEDPSRSPYIAQAVAEIAALEDTITIDSL